MTEVECEEINDICNNLSYDCLSKIDIELICNHLKNTIEFNHFIAMFNNMLAIKFLVKQYDKEVPRAKNEK